MNMSKKYLAISLLLLTGGASAISPKMAYVGTGATATIAGITTYQSLGSYKWLSIPAAGLGMAVGHLFFHQFTPAGRMERANNELNAVKSFFLARQFFTTEDQLLREIQGRYISHTWPLIVALDNLKWYMDLSLKIVDLADAAQQEDSAYMFQAEQIKQIAYNCFENMSNTAKIIRVSKDYTVQLDQFKEEQRHKEHLQVQQSMAAAQWHNAHAQQQMATSQKEFVNAYTQEHVSHGHAHSSYGHGGVSHSHGSTSHGHSHSSHGQGNKSEDYGIAFTESQANEYITQNGAALERALRAHMRSVDLSDLKRSIKDAVKNAQYAYQNNAQFLTQGKRYKKDIIDQFISSAVLEYIEKTSYHYAYDRIKDSSLATRISESMRNNALALIAQNSAVDFERLAPFVGFALERAVNDKVKQWAPVVSQKPTAPISSVARPSAPPVQNEKMYTSSECCVCLEDFEGTVERIYLKPCGHDMCKICAYEWFFGTTQKKECPQCRGPVNLNKLQEDIL